MKNAVSVCPSLTQHEPFFSTSTDCLIGSIPAACEPRTAAWFCSHALTLTVSPDGLGVQNSGWRALPFLILAEPRPDTDRSQAVHALLENGFFVAFSGEAEGERPAAGLICGVAYGRFDVSFAKPDGTVGRCFLPFSAPNGVQVLRGLRVRRGAYRFDASAARELLCRLEPRSGVAADYHRLVLLPTCDPSTDLSATWRKEEAILCRFAEKVRPSWR